jgi:hypothetical protein
MVFPSLLAVFAIRTARLHTLPQCWTSLKGEHEGQKRWVPFVDRVHHEPCDGQP